MLMRFVSCGLLLVSSMCAIPAINADTIHYGDLESFRMLYSDISESSFTENLPLFGEPSLDGDALIFANPTFLANVADDTLDFVDGRLNTTVTAKNGQLISSFELVEFGNFQVLGNDAEVFASAIGFVITDAHLYSKTFQFSHMGEGNDIWTASLVFEFPDPVSSFSLVVDNQLFARAGSGAFASINKEGIRLTTVTIPEPSAIVALIASICFIAVRRRR